jgi:hypothetical protein
MWLQGKQTNIGGLYFQSHLLPSFGVRLYVYTTGNWNMGIKQNSWLGLGYQLCLVVGIGHAGTLISAVLLFSSAMEN